jgi:type I restriction enzyme R subunit
MSTLLDEIIRDRRAKANDYAAYLARVAELVKTLAAGKTDDTPQGLDTPGKRALYNNLGKSEELALRIDAAVKTSRSDDWRGVEAKERAIKAALYKELQDKDEVERIFVIIKSQREY